MPTAGETLKTKITKFINDITTLEVTTVSGDVAASVIVDPNTKKVDFAKIWSQLTPAAGQPTTLLLIASTKIDFDKDVTQYVKADLTEGEKELVKLHNEAVKNSSDARKAAIESVVSIAKELMPNVLK